jgi:SAM-dependent methyltransferase
MTAAYDAIAVDYQRTKASPLRRAVENYTLDQLLGRVQGLAILDAGCGDGHHARRLMAAGSSRVVGLDVSARMLALARAAEREAPLGIRYAQVAIEDLPDLYCDAGFDLVLAAYLLHYAPEVGVLGRMCTRLGNALRPGGRLVALVENPDAPPVPPANYSAYGLERQQLAEGDASPVTWQMVSGRQLLRLDTFWYSRAAYAAALETAGFTDVHWHALRLDPATPEPGFYAEYLRHPPVLGLTAVRG